MPWNELSVQGSALKNIERVTGGKQELCNSCHHK